MSHTATRPAAVPFTAPLAPRLATPLAPPLAAPGDVPDTASPAEPLEGLAGLEFAPGTNASGELAAADWRFLLPSLHPATVLFVGVPSDAVVAALARTAGRVIVACEWPAAARITRAAAACGLTNVHGVRAAVAEPLPCADGSVDLVAFGAAPGGGDAADPAQAEEVARVLAPDGVVYLELHGRGAARCRRAWRRRLEPHGFADPEDYWLLRRRPAGIRLAVPADDARAVRYAFAQVLHGTSRRAALLRWGGSWAACLGLHAHVLPVRALVFRRAAGSSGEGCADGGSRGARAIGSTSAAPARYLAAIAERAGVELGRIRPTFFARGAYDSNKIAFFLFPPSGAEPPALVKITRAPRYNHRLEAEYRALAELRARALADEGTYPEPLFLGRHHDLAVVGERVVPGVPFRTRTRGDVACPMAGAAVRWLQELGGRSAVRPADPGALARALGNLLTRFEGLYALTDAERGFLRERVAAFEALGATVPTVFQHGDAGTWNALVTPDGRVAFLDWEMGRARGMPLWDLVDFLRSFGSWAARVRGERDMVRAYAARFLAPSPFRDLQAEAVAGYCARVGLPRPAVEPLFYACWMQRAVREAAWTSRPLAQGLYVNLVRACVAHAGRGGFA